MADFWNDELDRIYCHGMILFIAATLVILALAGTAFYFTFPWR